MERPAQIVMGADSTPNVWTGRQHLFQASRMGYRLDAVEGSDYVEWGSGGEPRSPRRIDAI